MGLGFNTRIMMMEHGMDWNIFKKFKKTFLWALSLQDLIKMMFTIWATHMKCIWNDVDDDNRGFHLFDTETLEHIPVNNPYSIFIRSSIMMIWITNYLTLDN
jgi:hypothetical protein